MAHESCIERRATETEKQRQIERGVLRGEDRQQAKPTGESTRRRTTTAAAAMTWQGAATQLTGKLELYILAGTAPPPPLCSSPLPVSVVRLLLIASANNNLCVVSGQKAVSATGNIFSVCFSCLLHYLCSCK